MGDLRDVTSVGAEAGVCPLQQSRVGRDMQRYGPGGRRLLACAVITRSSSAGDGEREVLVISSSKHPNTWILPKGGWESDESIEACVLREANEEAGIAGEVVRSLGEWDYVSKCGEPHRFYGFELASLREFERWAEAETRARRWVTVADARELLAARPELLEMLARATITPSTS